MRHTFWLAAASAFALAACNDPAPAAQNDNDGATAAAAGDAAPETAGEAVFTGSGAWVRNPPPGRDVTAGFLTLAAEGAPARLVDARSNAAARVEIHTMAMEDDVMRMRRVDGLDIPAGGSIALAPGGDHLMLFEIDRDVLATGQVLIELVFENGQTVNQVFEVRDTAPDAAGN
jgi:copper(I)-binding protein